MPARLLQRRGRCLIRLGLLEKTEKLRIGLDDEQVLRTPEGILVRIDAAIESEKLAIAVVRRRVGRRGFRVTVTAYQFRITRGIRDEKRSFAVGIGLNPLDTLRRNIGGYSKLN